MSRLELEMAALRWGRRRGSGRGYLEWYAGVLHVSTNQIITAFLRSALSWQPLTSALLGPCSRGVVSEWETPWMCPGRARGLWLSTGQQEEHHRSEVKIRLHFVFVLNVNLVLFWGVYFLYLFFFRIFKKCILLSCLFFFPRVWSSRF